VDVRTGNIEPIGDVAEAQAAHAMGDQKLGGHRLDLLAHVRSNPARRPGKQACGPRPGSLSY